MITATRTIGIDAAHRVTTHGSKCAHLHGHRYTIELTVACEELGSGAETGMVTDFSCLKEVLEEIADATCDHGLILWNKDPWVETFVPALPPGQLVPLDQLVVPFRTEGPFGKVWLIPCVPTAENLARLWLHMARQAIVQRTSGRCRAIKVVVHETPNCRAEAT